MNVTALSLRDLEYLIAVAEYTHFGKAARAAHVSQPALSTQIRKVEELLGVRLFERSNRRVRITPAGERMVAQARVVLDEARRMADIVHGDQKPLSGIFRLGAISTLGPYYLPYVLAPLRKRYPDLMLYLREGLTAILLDDLRAGKLDAVLASPTTGFDESLDVIPLFTEPFMLAVPKGHRLAVRSPLRPSDLRVDDMVLLEDGHCLKDQSVALCPRNRRGHVRQYQATSLETLRHLVATGLGYTLIPLLAATEDAKLRRLLCYRAFDGKPVGRPIVLVFRRRYARTDDRDALVRLLKEHLPDGVLPAKPDSGITKAAGSG
ncbi:MAG: LysR substrate-binding domain-containing protein [Acidiferrobacteraceae bacterium]